MDSVLASINNELTYPGRLIAAATPNYTVIVYSGTVINPNTSKNRVLPFINNTPVTNFTGNTITFPSTTAGGTISWTGGGISLTTVANAYYAILVQLLSTGNLSLVAGPANGTISGITIPTGSTQALSLGYIIISTNSSNIINVITNSMIYQMPLGGGSASASGSGVGDDLDALQYQSDVTESFSNSPSASATLSTVDTTQSNATYSSTNQYMTMSYDASKTVTGTGTAMTMSAAPAYTVAVGDILCVGTQARKITVVSSQTSYTIEAAFSTNPSASACCVSQAVYSKDLNNYAFNGVAVSAIYTGTISDCLVTYNDTSSGTNYNYTDPSLIGYTASGDGSTYTTVQSREANPSATLGVTSLATTGSDMYVRFFSNASSGSGTVNLTNYKVFFHRLSQTESGGIQYQAICFTNGVGTPVGCSNPTVVGGVTQIALTNSYPVGVNSGTANGGLRVYLNGQKIPRFINSTLTPDASYTEVNANTIQLDKNYSSYNYSVEVYQEIAVVDSNTQNTTNIAAITEHQFQNYLVNGAFDFWQRGTSVSVSSGTPAYEADRWFCNNTSGASATYAQTSGAVTGSKFGASVTYGSATGSGLALTQVVENSNTLPFLGNQASFGVWVKGLNLTNQVTVSIGYATSETKTQTTISSQSFTVNSTGFTYCSITGVNIGTLPTSAGSISVTVTAGTASSGNAYASGNGFVIEQAVLNIGGVLASFSRSGKNIQEEFAMCQRYYEKSYDLSLAPGTSGTTALNTGRPDNALSTSDFYTLGWQLFKTTKRASPTITLYSANSGTSGKFYDQQATADVAASAGQIGTNAFKGAGAGSLTAGTYSLACRNNGTTQSYVTTFTVTAASTWQYVTVTVPPYTGTSGNNFTNGSGMYIDFCALGGSTYQTSTLGSWQSGSYFVASTATNFFATNGATINIAQISLVEGETSIGATGFQRAGDTISEELRMCQRYYEKSYDIGVAPGSTNEAGLTAAAALSSTVVEIPSRNYKVTKRADPNVVIYSYNGTINELSSSQNSANASSAVILRGGMSGMLDITVSGATTGNLYWFHWTSDCDL
ncbi:unnamed protein product [Sphagnum balticum]